MRKRLFFVVKQLNKISSAELCAVSFSAYLNEDYDVFLYSAEKIIDNKVNGVFSINPRVTIRSLDLPLENNKKDEYIKNNQQLIIDSLSMSSRDNDIFVFFEDTFVDFVKGNVKKVLIEGFYSNNNYSKFDKVVFLTKQEYDEKCNKYSQEKEKFEYLIPFSRFDHEEDFKFHGNRIVTVSRFDENRTYDKLFEYIKGLKDSGLKFSLAIVGEGEKDYLVQEGLNQYDINDVVDVVYVKELLKQLQESDLLLYIEEDDIYPLFLVESIACSVPVVSVSNNKYIKDILENVGIFANTISDAIENTLKMLRDKIKLSKTKFETFELSRKFSKGNAIKILKSTFDKF